MKFDHSKYDRRIKVLEERLRLNIENTMVKKTEDMQEEIADESALRLGHSPSWRRAISKFEDANGNKVVRNYFTGSTNPNGLLEAIGAGSIGALSQGDHITIGFGDIKTLDEYAPYWRMFLDQPYGSEERSGGSSEYRFAPKAGAGRTGEGFSTETDGEGNPGVMPVFLYEDVLQYNKKVLRVLIQEAIKKSIKEAV